MMKNLINFWQGLGRGFCILAMVCVVWGVGVCPQAEALSLPTAPSSVIDPIEAAILSPDRPRDDRLRDGDRHPGDLLRFCQIKPGMTVADIMAGTGYYTEILSHLVGTEGRVYLHNEVDGWPWERFFPPQIEARLANDRLPNVVALNSPLESLGLPINTLDRVILVQFFHDTVWMGIDRSQFLDQVKNALKPDGLFCVLDHAAIPGSGESVAKTLHRIDPAIVIKTITQAGFTLNGQSDAYRNAQDDRQLVVFDPAIRNHTDQFLFRFLKEDNQA